MFRSSRPPVLARWLLRRRLPGPEHDGFAGDLEERFRESVTFRPIRARLDYWREVLSPTVRAFRSEVRGMPSPPGSSPVQRGDGWMSSVFTEVRHAFRALRKSPGFTAIAIVSLALGIGPNTAVFSLLNTALFQDWGVDDPERIVDIYTRTDEEDYLYSYYGTKELIEEGAPDVFEGVAAHSLFSGRIATAGETPETVVGEMVTGNYFDVMGVRAALGRTFLPEEDETLGTHPVVVLSDRYWERRYGRDPSIVGGTLRLNDRPYDVIGIAPAEFRGRIAPGVGSDFWVPLRMYPHLQPGKLDSGDLTISGRLREGVGPGQASAAVETVVARYNAEADARNPDRRTSLGLTVVSLADVRLHPDLDGILSAIALLLTIAVGLVLLVACVNLAGFLLSRATDRRKEVAIRVAMGAGRSTIVRQLLIESLILAGIGAVVGLLLGQLSLRALTSIRVPLPVPITLQTELDFPLLLFTAGIAVVAAVLFGLKPALEATKTATAATLRDEGGTATGGRDRAWTRGVLVGVQMALSTLLLFGAVLFLRSLEQATQIDVGFSTEPAAVVRIEASANEYTGEQTRAFVDELLRRAEARPGVEAVGVTLRMPLALGVGYTRFDVPGLEPPPGMERHRVESTWASPGYFEVLGLPVLEGRGFDASDREGSVSAILISQAAAEQYWPGESAVGKVVYRGGGTDDPLTVVGVVGNAKIWSLTEAPRPYLYMPFHQVTWSDFYVTASGRLPAAELAAAIRDEARAIDPDIYITEVGTLADHLGYVYFLPRASALALSLVAGLALILAMIGLYGMVSYGVAQRTREMGVRLALGAERNRVRRLIMRTGLSPVVVGGIVGIVASLALGKLLEGFLFGVGGTDPAAALMAPVLLAAVAGVAAWVPASRASRVDPAQVLRGE